MSQGTTRFAALPASQPRSEATRDRLLDAAEAALARGGPAGATVPAIARRAGVAVGSVYRRFPDKDALLRGVHERFFARSLEGNRAALAPERWKGRPAAAIVRELVTGLVLGYREHRALLAGLIRFAESHPDGGFRRRAEEVRTETFRWIGDLLLSRRSEIRHPRPEPAIEFILLVIGLALRGMVLEARPVSQPFDESALIDELIRLALGYLGIEEPRGRAARPRSTVT